MRSSRRHFALAGLLYHAEMLETGARLLHGGVMAEGGEMLGAKCARKLKLPSSSARKNHGDNQGRRPAAWAAVRAQPPAAGFDNRAVSTHIGVDTREVRRGAARGDSVGDPAQNKHRDQRMGIANSMANGAAQKS